MNLTATCCGRVSLVFYTKICHLLNYDFKESDKTMLMMTLFLFFPFLQIKTWFAAALTYFKHESFQCWQQQFVVKRANLIIYLFSKQWKFERGALDWEVSHWLNELQKSLQSTTSFFLAFIPVRTMPPFHAFPPLWFIGRKSENVCSISFYFT